MAAKSELAAIFLFNLSRIILLMVDFEVEILKKNIAIASSRKPFWLKYCIHSYSHFHRST